MSIYVETFIRCDLEDLWQRTQDPALHQRWDLRFSTIEYLPRVEGEPQHFRYETRIGFGLLIRGEGSSTGTRNGTLGDRTSALRFWSDDAKSLIREGSGYWRYIPTADGVRFLTWYDYRTRFGPLGRLVDALIFKPLMGWATAWSFDRLRLWIEKGIDPAMSLRWSLVHATSRVATAIVFLYQGLVPKLLLRHTSELRMLTDAGLDARDAQRALLVIGVAEVILGVLILARWQAKWPLIAILILMPVALLGVSIFSPAVLAGAFNPVALNLAVAALASVALLSGHVDLPSATRCLRVNPDKASSEPS